MSPEGAQEKSIKQEGRGQSTNFEGILADGLLAGLVCLSPSLAGSLRDADVAHVGSMEDEGLNI